MSDRELFRFRKGRADRQPPPLPAGGSPHWQLIGVPPGEPLGPALRGIEGVTVIETPDVTIEDSTEAGR